MADEMERKSSLEEARAKIAANQAKKEAEDDAIAEHEVQAGETLSGIAQKYYGNGGPTYYTHIYNANKEVIGDDMNVIKAGQKLVIPAKPEVGEDN